MGGGDFGSSLPMKIDMATMICPLLESVWAAAVGANRCPINARPPTSSVTPDINRIFCAFIRARLRPYFAGGLAAVGGGAA